MELTVSTSPTVDPRPNNPRACCILCATWVCHECYSWHRNGASRTYPQYCTKCGGVEGQFIAVRHSKPHGSWRFQLIPRSIPLFADFPKTPYEIARVYFYL